MKKLEFKTIKGEFLLLDMVGEESAMYLTSLLLDDDTPIEVLGKVKYIIEEQVAEVVDSITWRYTSGGSNTVYRNYLCNNELSGSGVLESAKESFESLVKSLGWYLWENPVTVPMHKSNNIKEMSKYIEAESQTLYNPVLLKKL